MQLIKGKDLTKGQLEQVKAAFVYRFEAIGKGKWYPTESAWVNDHAFYFNKSGYLSRNRHFCVPHYMAD